MKKRRDHCYARAACLSFLLAEKGSELSCLRLMHVVFLLLLVAGFLRASLRMVGMDSDMFLAMSTVWPRVLFGYSDLMSCIMNFPTTDWYLRNALGGPRLGASSKIWPNWQIL